MYIYYEERSKALFITTPIEPMDERIKQYLAKRTIGLAMPT